MNEPRIHFREIHRPTDVLERGQGQIHFFDLQLALFLPEWSNATSISSESTIASLGVLGTSKVCATADDSGLKMASSNALAYMFMLSLPDWSMMWS